MIQIWVLLINNSRFRKYRDTIFYVIVSSWFDKISELDLLNLIQQNFIVTTVNYREASRLQSKLSYIQK